MSIKTHSVFYYGLEIDETNNALSFNEGSGEIEISLDTGFYTHQELADHLKTKIDAASTLPQVYTVTFNRDERTFSFSASANFSLLVQTATQFAISVFPTIGFTGTDRTGTNSYAGNNQSGKAYYPQFFLQDYLDDRFLVEKIEPSVSESAEGQIQQVAFGTRKYVKMNIKFITDLPQDGRVIKNNPNGVNDFLEFYNALIDKRPVEFMPNENNRAVYKSMIIETLSGSQDGTGFEVVEMISSNLPEYYETGLIKFRLR